MNDLITEIHKMGYGETYSFKALKKNYPIFNSKIQLGKSISSSSRVSNKKFQGFWGRNRGVVADIKQRQYEGKKVRAVMIQRRFLSLQEN